MAVRKFPEKLHGATTQWAGDDSKGETKLSTSVCLSLLQTADALWMATFLSVMDCTLEPAQRNTSFPESRSPGIFFTAKRKVTNTSCYPISARSGLLSLVNMTWIEHPLCPTTDLQWRCRNKEVMGTRQSWFKEMIDNSADMNEQDNAWWQPSEDHKAEDPGAKENMSALWSGRSTFGEVFNIVPEACALNLLGPFLNIMALMTWS